MDCVAELRSSDPTCGKLELFGLGVLHALPTKEGEDIPDIDQIE